MDQDHIDDAETAASAPETPAPEPEDSAREHQPSSRADVEDAAEQVEQLGQHRRSFDDTAGTNPDRSQDSAGDPDGRPDD